MSEINNLKENSSFLKIVEFKLGRQNFGVDILNVNEILKMVEVTAIPNSPDCIKGIVNIRGKILPVVDTRQKLKMPKIEYDNDTRIIVIEMNDRTVGFIVDEVNEVLRIPKNNTEAPPDVVMGNLDSGYITSVARIENRLLLLLDLQKLMTSVDFVEA
jgi:purine-binding chemotaxis protein CheW